MDSGKVEQLSPVNSKSITITRQLWEYFYGSQPDFILAFRKDISRQMNHSRRFIFNLLPVLILVLYLMQTLTGFIQFNGFDIKLLAIYGFYKN